MVEVDVTACLAEDVLNDSESETAGGVLAEDASGGGFQTIRRQADAFVAEFEEVAVLRGVAADPDGVTGAG